MEQGYNHDVSDPTMMSRNHELRARPGCHTPYVNNAIGNLTVSARRRKRSRRSYTQTMTSSSIRRRRLRRRNVNHLRNALVGLLRPPSPTQPSPSSLLYPPAVASPVQDRASPSPVDVCATAVANRHCVLPQPVNQRITVAANKEYLCDLIEVEFCDEFAFS